MNPQPIRVQLSRAKGWRMPENTVKVDRTTRWGNPFRVGEDGTREHVTLLFTVLTAGHLVLTCECSLEAQKAYPSKEIKAQLSGKNLACWCKLGNPCHADVLLEIANEAAA